MARAILAYKAPLPPPFSSFVGDRAPDRLFSPPTQAFVGSGGNIWNIKTHFGAVGDGVADDTQAFINAYDAMLQALDPMDAGGPNDPFTGAHTVWIPHGTYKVTNTIIYTGTRTAGGFEAVAGVRFQGQSRAGSIIKLADGAAGFGSSSTPKNVLSLQKTATNPLPARNQIRDLTIDCGNNPGAVGLSFQGANLSEMRNLAFSGNGVAGIRLYTNPTHAYSRDILVDGFQKGIWFDSFGRGTHYLFEHVTLRNQTICSIDAAFSCSTTFRKLLTSGSPLAARVTVDGMHVVVLDSKFTGSGSAAITVSAGQLFLRNCTADGFANVIESTGPIISEYHNGPLFRHSSSTRSASLNLQIEDIPETPYAAASDWARPEDYGGSVQNALNSGKSHIYLPATSYNLGTVNVPATVKRIMFMHRGHGGTWNINEASSDPLHFEDGGSGGSINVNAGRTVEVSFVGSRKTFTSGTPRTIHISNGWGMPNTGSGAGVTRYCRGIDQEVGNLPFLASGAGIWIILGWKAEQATAATTFRIENGATVEILGGNQGVRPPANIIDIDHATAAVVFASCGFGEVSGQNFIHDVQNAGTTTFQGQQLVARSCIQHSGTPVAGATCPLYLTP